MTLYTSIGTKHYLSFLGQIQGKVKRGEKREEIGGRRTESKRREKEMFGEGRKMFLSEL